MADGFDGFGDDVDDDFGDDFGVSLSPSPFVANPLLGCDSALRLNHIIMHFSPNAPVEHACMSSCITATIKLLSLFSCSTPRICPHH